MLSALIVLSGCDGPGSRELLRGPTDGFSISVKAGKGGTMSFGALVPCAEEAGVRITGIRPDVAHGQVRIAAWGHRPSPALIGRDLLGAETAPLPELGFDTTAPVAVANICGPKGFPRERDPQKIEVAVQVVSADATPAWIENLLLEWSSAISDAHGTTSVPWTLIMCGWQTTTQSESLGC
jgi:hypothetical protein